MVIPFENIAGIEKCKITQRAGLPTIIYSFI